MELWKCLVKGCKEFSLQAPQDALAGMHVTHPDNIMRMLETGVIAAYISRPCLAELILVCQADVTNHCCLPGGEGY